MSVVVNEFATPFVGVDRNEKAPVGARDSRGKQGPNSAWFNDANSHSNFRFLSIYLTHPPIPPNPSTSYTDTSCHVGNQWVRSWKELLGQGWGAFFVYAGYTTLGHESDTNRRPNDFANTGNPQRYGKLHAQHAKIAIAEFYTKYKIDNDGAVVFLDNEGGKLWEDTNLLLYYNAFFEEMRKPGPKKCQPIRPGLYAWGRNSCELVSANPDLFVWWLDGRFREVAVRKNNNEMYAIPKESKDFLYLEPEKFPLRAAEFTINSGAKITLLPTGIQGLLNYARRDPFAAGKIKAWQDAGSPRNNPPKFDNFPNLPVGAVTPNFLPMTPWDLDMSFGRDPRYPQASPRIAVDPSGSQVARGTYTRTDKRMVTTLLEAGKPFTFQGTFLEPEAPVLLATPDTCVSLDTSGALVYSDRSNAGAWSPFTALLSNPGKILLRRARALKCSWLLDGSIHLFFISRDQLLFAVSRSTQTSPWVGPTQLHKTAVHGFSNLTVAGPIVGPGLSINLFHISNEGLLSQTRYTPPNTSSGTITATFSYIEPFPSNAQALCLGTSLIAFSPHFSTSLVFGISRQSLLLTMFVYNANSNIWSVAQPLGSIDTHKLFVHSRLAASQPTSANPLHVQVAAVSYKGTPIILNIIGTKNSIPDKLPTWDLAPQPGPILSMETFPRQRPPTPPSQPATEVPGTTSAEQWTINPFSDVCFGFDPTFDPKAAPKGVTAERVLVIAGTGPDGAVGVLFRRVRLASEDWFRMPAWTDDEQAPTTVLHQNWWDAASP
jgi:hypothetical protein